MSMSPRLKKATNCGAIFTLLLAFVAPAEGAAKGLLTAALESITTEELYRHVEVLADDVYEGRAAGSRGGRAAAQYLLQQLRGYRFEPAGEDGDYVQPFGDGCRNILLLHRGDDPTLADEVIVVGAHYDHVGLGSRRNSNGPIGQIHNGADDNASGVAVLLETIDALAVSGMRTRRSILFAFWDAEENELAGSRHWMANPTWPLARVKLAITVDMVGRLRDGQLYVLGTRSGYGLRRLMSGAVAEPLWLDFSWEIQANSDHWSFFEREIPGVLLHSGLHYDYHRPSDDVEKINRDGMRAVARYLLSSLITIANEDQLPRFRPQGMRETLRAQRVLEQPLPPRSLATWPADEPRPRLGISWRADEAEPSSVFITRVVEQSPAAVAGLQFGDRLYELNGQTFADPAEFQMAILSLLDAAPAEFTMLIERRGHLRTMVVKLPSE